MASRGGRPGVSPVLHTLVAVVGAVESLGFHGAEFEKQLILISFPQFSV